MAARTGEEYLKGLRARPRDIRMGSERIDDVTEHPAFAGGAQTVAGLFDLQHEYAEQCLFPDPETEEAINVSHMTPHSKEDLKRRRAGLEVISAATVGMMGRDPGFDNISLAGFVAEPALWAGPDGRNAEGAENLARYQRMLRRDDLSTTHALVQPTIDKARENLPAGHPEPLHKVDETAESIIVSGARALATLAPYADELLVWSGGAPIPTEGTESYALAFALPIDTPGLIFLARDSALTPASDPFDRPLSTRFDEQDCFVIFDRVEVPKDRVFINGDPMIYLSVLRGGFFPNMQQHTTIRALTKLTFAYGLASQMAKAVNDTSDSTIDMLGELLSYVELTRSALLLAEEHAREYDNGVVFPDMRPMDPIRATMPVWIPRAMEIIKMIGRHNLLVAPSRAMLDDPDLRPLLDIYTNSANGIGAEQRAELYRLAWDFVGSTLAGRQELYERFYIGSASTQRKFFYILADHAKPAHPRTADDKRYLTPCDTSTVKERSERLVEGILCHAREASAAAV